jgi:hypothetical protein
MPRRSLTGFLQRAPFLDVQSLNGDSDTYSGQFTGTTYMPIDRVAGPMRLAYTPPVDAWWEVHGNIGLVTKVDANYNYLYGALSLSPADVDGITGANHLLTQHLTVQTYDHRTIHRIFKLAAGVAYTVGLGFVGGSGGTWQYYRGSATLFLQAKAWAR